MVKVTPEIYERSIPSNCALKTYEEHLDTIMLCWGLMSSIENNYQPKCGICEFNCNKAE